jgi:hypothetical protein
MEFKNRTFKFFGQVWSIKFVDHAPMTEGQVEGAFNNGVIIPTERTIWISTKWPNGKAIDKETIENTVRHELVHMIFLNGQYLNCYDDEPLVEWTAKAIGQLIKSNLIS